ncbi:MAG TPA: hypothetical protein VF789_20400 [Thermoanaerobaculia bacterium]
MKKVVITLARVTAILAICAGITPVVSADHEICDPFCVTPKCSSHAQCRAAGYNFCNFACHEIGCCG